MLWQWLRGSPAGIKFRRQYAAGSYILDFYCPAAKLAVEIDGIAHDMGDRPQRDEVRTQWVEDLGIKVLRVAAKDVLADPEAVADALLKLCSEPLHHPANGPPLRSGEES